jgi:hypothetical protein
MLVHILNLDTLSGRVYYSLLTTWMDMEEGICS